MPKKYLPSLDLESDLWVGAQIPSLVQKYSPLFVPSPKVGAELTHPEIVKHLADALVVSRNLRGEVLVKAGFDREPGRQGRPVVLLH